MILRTSDKSYWLWGGASTGKGSAFCLGARGRLCCCFPSWSLKALHFRCCSTHVAYAPPTLAVIALDWFQSFPCLASFWLFLAALFWLLFCLWDFWTLLLAFWLIFLWLWLDPCCGGFCGAVWAPLPAAIKEPNCYISTHFAQGSQGGALGSGLVVPSLHDGTSLTMTDIEAQELLCFSCSCAPSAFLAAHMKTM